MVRPRNGSLGVSINDTPPPPRKLKRRPWKTEGSPVLPLLKNVAKE